MNDGWTVQFVPKDSGRTRTFTLTRRGLALAGGGVGVLVLLVAAWIVVFGVDVTRSTELQQLEARNDRLSEELATAEERTDRLARSLDQMASREERFRLMAGLPLIDPDIREVGVGGPATERADSRGEAVNHTLDRLLRRSRLLSASLGEATDSVRVHREVFLSRPSIRPVASQDSWISSSYSHSRYHPILHHNKPHTGVDISARHGAPILASARGTVVFAGQVAGYGRTVEIEHGYGYRTRYAHAASISVREGQEVRRGDVVGTVGESGLTTGPNLHYEVLVNGRPVDPRPYLLGDRLFQ
jgi:murein DD-endopeptidase MepM/ murein hydrolase activator NlpD